MIPYYEYIVVGCGGIGSGTLYWLSKISKSSVLGLEQYSLGHDHGGSQDHSRIIRHMYLEEMYTRLTQHTYDAWAEVEKESGVQLVHRTGSLDLARKGTPGIDTLEKYAFAMKQQNQPFERLTAAELRARYPQWTVDDSTVALLQPDGGLVDAALGNSVHIQLARAHGADILENVVVIKLEPIVKEQCIVHTSRGTFRCRRVVVTAGAWLNQVLASVDVTIPVTVTQEQVTYLATNNVKEFTKDRFPVFIYHSPSGFDVYGMPSHVNACFKIGLDSTGPAVTPATRNYVPDADREKYCLEFTKNFLPKAVGPIQYTKTCLYTMTLDRNFVVDTLASRGLPQIVLCCGAGHAYKFASFLGQVLTELAMTGRTGYKIEGFTFQREAVQNPTYPPIFWRGDVTRAKL